MSKKKAFKEKKVEEKIEKKEVKEEKKVEEKVEKKEVKEEKVEHKIDGRKLGKAKLVIESVVLKKVNGRDYNEIKTIDGQTFLLTDEELKAKINC